MSYPISTPEPSTETAYAVGDLLRLPLPVGATIADGIHPSRLAVVAAVETTLGTPVYEIVPSDIADDLPAHDSDIAVIVTLHDGTETTLRLALKCSLRVLPDAQILAGAERPVGRLPQLARASLVGAQAQRQASRRRHEEARRERARSSNPSRRRKAR